MGRTGARRSRADQRVASTSSMSCRSWGQSSARAPASVASPLGGPPPFERAWTEEIFRSPSSVMLSTIAGTRGSNLFSSATGRARVRRPWNESRIRSSRRPSRTHPPRPVVETGQFDPFGRSRCAPASLRSMRSSAAKASCRLAKLTYPARDRRSMHVLTNSMSGSCRSTAQADG
jgi:hypothetical protein